jgi:CoA:oxalate CoA-transferase
MSNNAASPATGRKGPLSGFRVLTVDNYFAGNYGPLLLAFHGAEVVKIEQPGSGDPLRTDAPYLDPKAKSLSHGELRLMRGKSSVALDIRKPAGKEVLRKLIGSADVFWTNLRPAAAKRLGIEPEAVQGINPRLVYASVSGFGLPGKQPLPFQDEPAFDIIIQALTGLMSRNADPDETPHYNGVAIGDQVTSLFAAFGVVTALLARERGDPAACVDVSMFDSMLALNEKTFSLFSMDGIVRPPRISATNAPFGAYRGKDGFIVIGVGGHVLWERFCRAIGREDLLGRDDLNTGVKRVQQEKTLLRPLIEEWLRARTVREASKILLEHDVPASPILDIDSPILREQVSMRGVTKSVTAPDGRAVTLVQSPVRLSTESTEDFGLPRGLGADTNRVLTQWIGMDEAQITALRRDGVAG